MIKLNIARDLRQIIERYRRAAVHAPNLARRAEIQQNLRILDAVRMKYAAGDMPEHEAQAWIAAADKTLTERASRPTRPKQCTCICHREPS